MTKSNRSVAALLVFGGIALGILLTSGLRWTATSDSQPRQLNGSMAEVPVELQAMQQFNQAFAIEPGEFAHTFMFGNMKAREN